MKKVYLSALAILGSAGSLLAQNTIESLATSQPKDLTPPAISRRACGAMDVLGAQMAADPALAQRMEAIEAHTRRVIAAQGLNRSVAATGIITIPVVVHVLYNTAAQNISDAQVQSQIDVLNEDFNKLNADAANTPGVFTAATVGVRFALATRTPTGAATNGIIHKQTKVTSWSTNDAVKSSKRGGDNPWDASQYLNLWACNLGQGLLGYAQFPGGSASTDGVVILYSAFGSRAKYSAGTYTTTYDLGRTATHEVGHWLNLRHIWGDDNGACTGSDLVDDTPNQGAENYGCAAFPHVSCSNQGDMSMNYMDYTDDKCMYMFSPGQSARINAVLAAGGPRASLATSTGAARSMAALKSVSLYPNPAAEALNLSLPAGADAARYAVRVYDMSGHEMTGTRYNGRGQVEVGALPKGLYYLTIGNGSETIRQRFEKE
ncbi:T9SS type A sorting domain-containing protein [Hymenobacter sp. BT664]|uniref:T9SS type A sorting domain-containing protein n=1 Tax=Hymenobacter montanus TaxID=2771359 RepID=A0A927BEC4_9BACT|nr:M43 family zinc metalloprotease [Hymenobacter montanus]MBD2768543.1 T9SS type A sorting domain-containing protein [Hymenobacter montanus]